MFFIVFFPPEIIIEIWAEGKKCYNGNLCEILKAFAWHYKRILIFGKPTRQIRERKKKTKQTIPITFFESSLTTFLHFITSSTCGLEKWAKEHKNFISPKDKKTRKIPYRTIPLYIALF